MQQSTLHRQDRLARQIWFWLVSIVLFFSIPFAANAASTFGNNVSVGGTLTQTGAATFDGVIQPASNNGEDIGAYGAAWSEVFASGTVHIGEVTSANESTTAGDVNIGGQLVVDDEIFASSTITVQTSILPYSHDGADIGTNGTAAWNDLYTSGTAFIGDVNSSNQATTAGDVNIGGQLVVDDEIYASSTITVQTSILPYSNSQANIGAWDTAWNNIFASGSSYLAGATFNKNGTITFGTSTAGATIGEVVFNSPLASDIPIDTGNTRSIGSYFGALKDMYASGTIFSNSVSSTVLDVSGVVTIGTIDSSNEASAAGDVNVGGQLVVDDQLYASSTLAVQGAIYASSTIVVDGGVTVNASNGSDADFQVNNSFGTAILFTDVSEGNTGIGTSTPEAGIDVFSIATSSARIDSKHESRGGCLIIKDRDGDGYSYGTVNDGAITWSTADCTQG